MTKKKTHYAKIEASNKIYQVFYRGMLLLESDQVLELAEHREGKDYPIVIYFPKSVVSALELLETQHSTYCVIKGDASYSSYKEAENGIWSYPEPIDSVAQLKDHFAFDQKKGFQVRLKN